MIYVTSFLYLSYVITFYLWYNNSVAFVSIHSVRYLKKNNIIKKGKDEVQQKRKRFWFSEDKKNWFLEFVLPILFDKFFFKMNIKFQKAGPESFVSGMS